MSVLFCNFAAENKTTDIKDDVYKAKDHTCIHHEYIDCPECNEKI